MPARAAAAAIEQAEGRVAAPSAGRWRAWAAPLHARRCFCVAGAPCEVLETWLLDAASAAATTVNVNGEDCGGGGGRPRLAEITRDWPRLGEEAAVASDGTPPSFCAGEGGAGGVVEVPAGAALFAVCAALAA